MELLKKKFKNTNAFPWFLFLVVFVGLVFISQICYAEISVDAYCQLTIQSMQREISNLQELIALVDQYGVDQYGNDPVAFAQQEAQKKQEFEEQKNQLFATFGTTAEEYAMYMDKNSEKVQAYLAAHPDIKQQIDELSAQVNSLLEQYEAKKAAIKKSYEPQPPVK